MELERLNVKITADNSDLKKKADEAIDIVENLDKTKATVDIQTSSTDPIANAIQLVNDLKATINNKLGSKLLDDIIKRSQEAGSEIDQLKSIVEDLKNSPLAEFKGIISTEDTLKVGETIEQLTGYINEAEAATRRLQGTINGGGGVPNPTQNSPNNTPSSNSSDKDKGDSSGGGFGKLLGALMGVRTLYALIRKIVSQNEAFMAGVNNFFSIISSLLAPILNYLGAFLNTIAGWLGKIFGTSSKTASSTGTMAKSLAGFDEINNIGGSSGGGIGGTADPGKLKWVEDLLDGIVELVKGSIQIIWEFIKLISAAITVGLEFIVAVVAETIAVIVATIAGIVAGLVSAISELIKGITKTVSQLVADVIKYIFGIFTAFVDGYKKAREEGKSVIVAVFEGLWNSIKTTASNLWNLFKNLVTNIWNTISNTLSAFVQSFKNVFGAIIKWTDDNIIIPIMNAIKGLWDSFIKPCLDNIANAWGTIKNGFRNMMNGVIGFINNIIHGLNKIPGVNISGISYMASGGFPDVGQLFIANESGPELVGKIGNQSAVVNNQQIIEGIKQGVLEALSSASGTQNINLYLDGQQITNVVVKGIKSQSRVLGRSVI